MRAASSVRVAAEVTRRLLRLCPRRTEGTHPAALSVQPLVRPVHSAQVWGPRPSPLSLMTFHPHRSVYGEDKCVPSSAGDLSPPGPREDVSVFMARLQDCLSPSDVLDLTCQHTPTVREISNCLSHMWFISKKMSLEQRRYETRLMFENPAFEKLLQMAMDSVGDMGHDCVAYCLLSTLRLGVPQQSLVVQTLIRTCQENLNSFDEKSFSILASSLQYMDKTPNVSALQKAMILMFEVRLPTIKNVQSLQTTMRMLGKNVPMSLKKKLEKKALSMQDSFTLPNTQHMICTMAAIGLYSKPLLNICSKTVTENLNVIPTSRLLSLLYSYKDLQYRNVDVLAAISDYAASTLDMWTNKQVCLLLSVFDGLAFCPAAFMEALATRLIACPHSLTLKDLLCILRVYSSFNYDLQQNRQQFLDCLTQALESYLPKMPEVLLLKCVFYLSLMGHFPSAPLEQLLQKSTLEQFQGYPATRKEEEMFRILDACLRLERPPLPRPLAVPPSVLGASPPSPIKNPWLSDVLHSTFEDQADTVLQENVMVENLYLIDALITKRVPARTSADEAGSCGGKDSSPAESSQRAAVIYAPHSAFCFGSTNPRGALAVKLRHLKLLGYRPVVVSRKELQIVPPEKRAEIFCGLIFPQHQEQHQLLS